MLKFIFLLLASVSVAAPASAPILNKPIAKLAPVAYNPYPGIRNIVCGDLLTGEVWSGTMVHIGNKRYMTANHVASPNSVCADLKTKKLIKIVYNDPKNDFALIDTPYNFDKYVFKYSCKGYTIGKTYNAIGWADGTRLKGVKLKALDEYSGPNDTTLDKTASMSHMRLMKGSLIPGMSGGAVFDKNWVIYGMNNAVDDKTNTSLSKELADTGLCLK